jgi:hypothetical protein
MAWAVHDAARLVVGRLITTRRARRTSMDFGGASGDIIHGDDDIGLAYEH